jgi:protein SCO1
MAAASRRWLRPALWGLLLAALLGVCAVAVVERLTGPPRSAGTTLAASPAGSGQRLPELGRVPDFTFTNRDGRVIRLADLAGAPWIADFVFTRCASSCPLLSAVMARLDRTLPAGGGVRLVSLSVDPTWDTAPVLASYARSFSASPRWLFLTGPPAQVQKLSRDGFKLALDPGGAGGQAPAEAILHSTRFVLIDARGVIRGYYQALDPGSVARLTADVRELAGEAAAAAATAPR